MPDAEPRPLALLADLPLGHVLDVATGAGAFVRQLLDAGVTVESVVGIDANAARADAFAAAVAAPEPIPGESGLRSPGAAAPAPSIRFDSMDAHALTFGDSTFDTVCISNSLHHFADPAPVLAEMLRVLRPGGRLIINEMYRDGQTPAQLTHVELHHWWAAINRHRGEIHRETYARADLLALIGGLGLADLRITDSADLGADPHAPDEIAELEGAIDHYLGLAAAAPDLIARGEELRIRLRTVGVHGATQLLAVGRTLPADDRAGGALPSRS